jgi:hypothetical protein
VRPRRVRRGQAAGLAGPGAVDRAAGESAVERRLPLDELLAEPPGLGLDRRLRLLGRPLLLKRARQPGCEVEHMPRARVGAQLRHQCVARAAAGWHAQS